MRSDMSKVIVERPRYGSRLPSKKKGYRRSFQRQGIEEGLRHEPMLGLWRGRQRQLNEHLGPMRRFLRSRVGRPWNKVHQELCENVSFDNAVQNHVLQHVFDYVRRYVELRDGDVILQEGYRWGRGRRLTQGEMYVCPETGLLKVVRASRHQSVPQRIQAGPLKQYHFRDNAWWEVLLRKRPEDPGELWDVWLERDVEMLALAALQQAYGGELIAISKRPLRPAEIKQLHRTQRQQSRKRPHRNCVDVAIT